MKHSAFLFLILFSPAFSPSLVHNSGDVNKIVAEEEIGCDYIGFLPPNVSIPACDGPGNEEMRNFSLSKTSSIILCYFIIHLSEATREVPEHVHG